MATNLTSKNDYINSGEFQVGITTTDHPMLDSEITIREEQYLEALLGARLYNKFQSDLELPTVGQPTAQKWVDFVNGVSYIPENDSSITINFKGVKSRMVKAFVFFYYMRDHQMKRTGAGNKVLFGENSKNEEVVKSNALIMDKFNIGLKIYCQAQDFIKEHQELSTPFDSFIENAPGEYVVTLPSNRSEKDYAFIGDVLTSEEFLSEEFTVTAIDYSNNQITVTSSAGLISNSGTFNYTAFADWITEEQHTIGVF